jgi:hypothetical protein
LRSLRVSKIKSPVLILSGLSELADKIKGLGFGADDYLTKPFHKDELVAHALGLLQALPQNLIVNKAPGILHRLDQSAFVVTRGARVSLSSIFGSYNCAVSPLRSDGSNCASSDFSSAGCQSGKAARAGRAPPSPA